MTLRPPKTSDASSIAAISIEVWIGTYLKRGVNAFFADYALQEFTPAKIELIKRVHNYLAARPEVGKVLSLASVMRVAEDLNDGKAFSGI